LNRPSSDAQIGFSLDVPDKTDYHKVLAKDFVLTNYKPTQPQLTFDLAI
jgi:hypothetical protein